MQSNYGTLQVVTAVTESDLTVTMQEFQGGQMKWNEANANTEMINGQKTMAG